MAFVAREGALDSIVSLTLSCFLGASASQTGQPSAVRQRERERERERERGRAGVRVSEHVQLTGVVVATRFR